MKELSADIRVWMDLQKSPDRVEVDVTGAIIEAGALCNLRCPFCPTGNGDLKLSREFLKLEGFKGILDALGTNLRRLALFNWGESLLNPDIYEMISAASSRNISVSLSTSLSLPPSVFSSKEARRLVESGLSRLIVSCDGASQETYRLYRVGGDFGRVKSNIKAVLQAKRRFSSARPEVVWKFLLHQRNRRDVPSATKQAAELGIPIQFSNLIFPISEKNEWGATAEPAQSPPPDSRREIDPPAPPKSPVPGGLCLNIWNVPVIHSDGSVLPCCAVNDPEYGLGNVFRESIRRLWNKPLIVAMRRYLKTGRKTRRKLPCYDCPHSPHARSAENWVR
jgi:radical SAM protein with 4Fe4S-binding SPASM domain